MRLLAGIFVMFAVAACDPSGQRSDFEDTRYPKTQPKPGVTISGSVEVGVRKAI